jgi:hypothetical protein
LENLRELKQISIGSGKILSGGATKTARRVPGEMNVYMVSLSDEGGTEILDEFLHDIASIADHLA